MNLMFRKWVSLRYSRRITSPNENSKEGPLYPFGKFNHVKILGLFTRHEKEAKFFHVRKKIGAITFHGEIKIVFTDKYFNILLPF